MRHLAAALLLLVASAAQASVIISRISNDGLHPSTMEIEVRLPDSAETIRIPLARSHPLEDVPMTLVENGVSRTFSASQVHGASHSHYRDIESRSVVSVRTVNGIRQISGHVMHRGVPYFLEPVGDSDHRVTPGVTNPERLASLVASEKATRVLSRRRRQTGTSGTEYTVELHLLLDSTVWSALIHIYGTDPAALMGLHFYYTHILNGIDTAYRNIGTPSISVSCIGLTISKSASDDKWMNQDRTPDGSAILRLLHEYKKDKIPADHVMAFTRKSMHDAESGGVAGIAYVSSICTDHGVSINQDQGLHSWATAAHELGHSLGSRHDGNTPGGCDSSSKFILAGGEQEYTTDNIANAIRFSPCSIEAISKHIKSLPASESCLLTAQGSRLPELTGSQREGARLTLNQVCRLSYPNTAGEFELLEPGTSPAAICARIYCKPAGESSFLELRAPAGTPCGSRKSCNWDGKCTGDPAAPAVDEACFLKRDTASDSFCQRLKPTLRKSPGACGNSIARSCCKTLVGVCPYY